MDNPPTKLQILTFIRDQEVVWIETLNAQFGYTYWGAVSRLKRLCKQGLIEPLYARGLNQGRYMLTNKGFERIKYLTEMEKSKGLVEQTSQSREDELKNEVSRLSKRVRELETENEHLRKLYLMMQGKKRA
jgi:predicted transcriptional regulator